MKIAYLVSQYPAINHTFILREIRALRMRGFDIPVISIRDADRSPDRMTSVEREEYGLTRAVKAAPASRIAAAQLRVLLSRPAGWFSGLITSLRLSGGHPRQALANLLYFAEAVVAGQWMKSAGVEHFHVHFASTVGLLITKIFPLTMSITFHGPDEFTEPASFHLAEKVAASSFLCAISFYARSQLMRHSSHSHWGRIEVARLGVDPEVFRPGKPRESGGPFNVICVARLAPVKAQHVLIEAVARLAREGRSIRLHLVGDGSERGSLEAHAAALEVAAHVVFHGWLNQDRVQALYGEADLFALASFAEGVPIVLMEAMAMEIPCVATYIAGVPELIENGRSGLLVNASDCSGLAGAIAQAMDDPMLRRRLGVAGREKVVQDFNLAANADLLAEIFRRRLGAINRGQPAGEPDRIPA